VPIVPSGFVHQKRIETAVARASRALAPDVIRIRYNFGEDWSGSAAVFFRVVLSDDASRRKQLRVAAQRVASTILNEVSRTSWDSRHTSISAAFQSRQNSRKKLGLDREWHSRMTCLSKRCIWRSANQSDQNRRACEAVSTAYYALFHLLITETTKNWKRPAERYTLARMFEHTLMGKVCTAKRDELDAHFNTHPPPSPQLEVSRHLHIVAETFVPFLLFSEKTGGGPPTPALRFCYGRNFEGCNRPGYISTKTNKPHAGFVSCSPWAIAPAVNRLISLSSPSRAPATPRTEQK